MHFKYKNKTHAAPITIGPKLVTVIKIKQKKKHTTTVQYFFSVDTVYEMRYFFSVLRSLSLFYDKMTDIWFPVTSKNDPFSAHM